jgi:hypothetical protein
MNTDVCGQKREPDNLERTEELFTFLQGKLPEGYKIPDKERPNLTAGQAWTVIWYLGNLYWQVTDHIERCDLCGELFDTQRGGDCLDYGKAPYYFCDNCMASYEYALKAADKRNPDNGGGLAASRPPTNDRGRDKHKR